ncbi:MAG: glycosyltransferase [Solirubrobacterales bacterium]
MSNGPPVAPLAVVDIERSQLDEMSIPPRAGSPYNGAFVLLRDRGRPVAIVTTTVGEDGRPLLSPDSVAELAALERPPADPAVPDIRTQAEPLISVVICVVDEGANALRCIDSILEGDYTNTEIVVVNNRPAANELSERLEQRYASDSRVRYHEEHRPGLSAARNSGAGVARGEIIAFTDDDVVADRRWVASIAAVFDDPTVDCVTGMILPMALETDAQWLLERFAGFGKGFEVTRFTLEESNDDPLFPFAAGRFGSGANISMRREVFTQLEGFDPVLGTGTKARGGEDLDTFIRLMMSGGTLVYEPAAIVWHEHRDRMEDLRREMFGYGAGLAAVITKQMTGPYRRRLLRRIPAGLRLMFDPSSQKNARKGSDFPQSLTWRERLGASVGPIGYLRSRLDARQWSAIPPVADDSLATTDPVWVTAVDIDAADVSITAPQAPSGNYARARLLVRRGEMPLGFATVNLENSQADDDAVRAALAAQIDLDETGRTTALPAPTQWPRFSVVVCTFDRPDSLLRAVRSVLASDYPDFELIVVDNAPQTNSTRDALSTITDSRVRYAAEPAAGLSRARNRGLADAVGELIAFTDDDVEVDPHWLRSLASAFAVRPNVGLVTGLVPAAELDNEFQQRFDSAVHWSTELTRRSYDLNENRLKMPTFPFRTGRMGAGANFAVSRECAQAVGGFDRALGAGAPCGGGDDLDYFLRVIKRGWTLSYEPSALVWHHHRADGEALLRQVSAYGSGATAYAFKHAFNPLNYAAFVHSLMLWLTTLSSDRPAPAKTDGGAWNRHADLQLPHTPMDRKLKRVWRRGAWRGPWLYINGRSKR